MILARGVRTVKFPKSFSLSALSLISKEAIPFPKIDRNYFTTMSGILQEELDILHKAVGDRGRLIFAMVAGSAAFNLATPTSDRDLFGVYLSNESGPFQAPTESIDSHEPDYAI